MDTQRYYLSQTDTGWLVTKQHKVSGKWKDQEVVGVYDQWEDAINSGVDPIAFDPEPDYPEELREPSG